ncbi:MAG: glycoside hydrolase family 3 C-terminal domain-containing protein [Bacteroidales bacterium]|nr:glycoside hydrolase family 3 C-terminal domain-containing protein [Bacteroidales bacterium]
MPGSRDRRGGSALGRILSGTVNPSGRLPVTFPVDYFDLPSSRNFPYDFHGKDSFLSGKEKDADVRNVGFTEYAEGLDVGYRYFQKEGTPEVSYPFGYGLSYTSFQESVPVFSDGAVTVTVTNTGAVPGKKVVQVYHPFLCAYGKTRQLQPGESQTLTWQLEGENSK